jgi:PPP family 3-phenylpropionic acid transporter
MLLMGVYWFAFCTYIAYMVTTLIDHGWSDSAAAGAITAMSVIVMLMQPVCGLISDKFISEKTLTVVLLSLAAVCMLALPFSLRTGSTVVVILNMIGITMTGLQVAGLMDAWLVGLKQEFQSLNYGLIRGSGSLSYALSAQIMGTVTALYGHGARLWVGSGVLVLSAILALTFRSARHIRHSGADGGQTVRLTGPEAFKIVFSSRQYVLLLAVAFFLLLNNASMITLIQLLMRDFGGTTAQVGTAIALGAGSEVPFMFFMAFIIKKVGYNKLLLFCGIIYVARMFITASAATADSLMYVQLLHGTTYAVMVPLSMNYLSKIVDERVRSTAVTTFAAITSSLTGILGNLVTTSFLAAGHSARSALIFFAFSALIGFGLTLYGSIRKIW